MKENDIFYGEFSQKYCPSLSAVVTLVSGENKTECMSSHLCRDHRLVNCDHYIASELSEEKYK